MATAGGVCRRSEGPVRDGAYYNWQSEPELRALYASLGLRWVALYPIDRLAWLSGVGPGRMTVEQRAQWLELERSLPPESGMWGRYVLVIAQQPR